MHSLLLPDLCLRIISCMALVDVYPPLSREYFREYIEGGIL